MTLSASLRAGAAVVAAAVAVGGLLFASAARTEDLKSYDSSKKDFWLHPPNDWFMGDETEAQKGTNVLNTLPPPTGITYRDGALYVIDIDKLYKYDNPEANLDKMPEPQVVYDDMPPYPAHGWKYLTFDKDGWLYVPFGPPCNICLPPTSVSQIRRVNPANGLAEVVALGVRNSVGGDVDPRTGDYWFTENARDWLGDDVPSDKLNHVTKLGEHFGYPYCHQGDIPDPKFAMGRKCSE